MKIPQGKKAVLLKTVEWTCNNCKKKYLIGAFPEMIKRLKEDKELHCGCK